MKSLLLVLLGCVAISFGAQAAELDNGGPVTPGNPTHVHWDGRYPYSITQNVDPTVLNSGGFSCGNVTYNYTTEAYSLRRYYFADEGIATPFTVQSVDWGVRRYYALGDSLEGPFAVDVQVYTIPVGAELLFANMTLVGTASQPITVQWGSSSDPNPAVGYPMSTAVNAVINDTVGQDMVVAIHAPDSRLTLPWERFACSASNLGEFYESYYAFADCGYAEPTTPTDLGSPGAAMLAQLINGDVYEPPTTGACCYGTGACAVLSDADCAASQGVWQGAGTGCDPNPCPPPVPTETTSWGQVKALYR
jgi:hypothetical protein